MKLKKMSVKDHLQLFALGLLVGITSLELFGAATSVASRFTVDTKASGVAVAKAATANACVADTSADAAVPTHITIAKANIDLPVVEQKLQNGTWLVADGVANYAMETSRVSSQMGNVGIFGHDRTNAFTRIKSLKKGDLIIVKTASGQSATYSVEYGSVTAPDDVQTFNPTSKPTLTLITCTGLFSEQRYVIKAKLVSLQKGSCYAKAV